MELLVELGLLCYSLCSAFSRDIFEPTYYQELLARSKNREFPTAAATAAVERKRQETLA